MSDPEIVAVVPDADLGVIDISVADLGAIEVSAIELVIDQC